MCTSENAKYKCPKCMDKYCSVTCCKHHKVACVGSDTSFKTKVSASNEGNESLLLKPEHIKLLNESTWLRSILGSKRLQDDVMAVETSGNRQSALKKLRSKNTEFENFVSQLLKEIGHNQSQSDEC